MTASRQDSSLNPTSTMVHPFLVNLHGRAAPFLEGISFAALNTSHGNHILGRGYTTHQAHGLSLSLGSHPQARYREGPYNSGLISNSFVIAGEGAKERSLSGMDQSNVEYPLSYGILSRCSTSCGKLPFSSLVGNSRHLKPTQSLLQEVVNVNDKVGEMRNEKCHRKLRRIGASVSLSEELKAELFSDGILHEEKNEKQLKILKLLALLEEVEKRFEKYLYHMEDIVSSFEGVVGPGSAEVYTSQPLEAMTKHFCFLSDEIVSHIDSIRRRLSQQSRDGKHRLSLHQIGYSHNQRHTWRPIRGLPESSVAILRAWLFEHFLHPYPNDPEKLMLASQTGLTKNQVSNWFINARVRLWKPMIEEMYKEELEDSPHESNSFIENNSMAKEDTNDSH